MKYYLIAGEASGDLHASHLMRALKETDAHATFRFFGGELMTAEGGTRVKHYKCLAYMGFIPVLLHLRTIFRNMALCKRDITEWQPHAVILVDYPGFNLNIARYLHAHTGIPVFYYISPKIWAWKEYRIRRIKRDVTQMFSILPFEIPFYQQKHHYPIHYVGNPTAYEVTNFRNRYSESAEEFARRMNTTNSSAAVRTPPIDSRPIIALLAGSRKQEIKDNLPAMIAAARRFPAYQMIVAGAPSVSDEYYARFITQTDARLVRNQTYALLSHASAALVTSGTATLEAAMFNVPQVVCYKTPVPRLIRFAFNHIIKVKYISLVNLIGNREIVTELFADRFSVKNITNELGKILPTGNQRARMLRDYNQVQSILGNHSAPHTAARMMVQLLNGGR